MLGYATVNASARVRSTARVVAMWLATAFASLGCVSMPVPIDPEQPVSLGAGEGLAIFHIDTDVAITLLRGGTLKPVRFAENVPVGESIWMVRMEEGEYAWGRLEIESADGSRYVYVIDSDPKYRFDVEAGKINYPGQLRVRHRERDNVLFLDKRQRSGRALRMLRNSHGEILADHGLRYGGQTRHDFLQYFTGARSAVRDASGAAPVAGER